MATRTLPTILKKWSVKKMINNFQEACELISCPVPEVGPNQVLVKNRFVGVNASDINVPAGRYDPTQRPPFDIGFEGVGEVIHVGAGCRKLTVGQPIGHTVMGAYSQYQVIPEDSALPLPEVKAEYVPFLVSGLGASIGLDKVGQIKKGDTVIVTAAAGGAGQIAVQYAKAKGCHVIGTCSSEEKVNFLKGLGCDRAINYKTEDVQQVLSTEYPNGINVVFENVGGEMLKHNVNNIAFGGRIVLFGLINSYEKADMSMDVFPNLAVLILRCAKLQGYLYAAYPDLFPEYLQQMVTLRNEGKLKASIDTGASTAQGQFQGLDDVPRAIEHLYSSKSFGKVVVELADSK